MSWKHGLRIFLRRWGIDLSRYDVAQSQDARLLALLTAYEIDTVLDVGANDGGYASQLLGSGYRGNILSFEPQRAAHQSLLKRMKGHTNWYTVPPIALGEQKGSVDLNIAANSASSSILPMLDAHLSSAPQSKYVSKERVLVDRLDNVDHPIISKARAIYLKIDTQGYEMPVLRGSRNLLPKIRGLQLEMSLVPLYEGQALFREIVDSVKEDGFELVNVIPGFSDIGTGHLLQMDGVFFRRRA